MRAKLDNPVKIFATQIIRSACDIGALRVVRTYTHALRVSVGRAPHPALYISVAHFIYGALRVYDIPAAHHIYGALGALRVAVLPIDVFLVVHQHLFLAGGSSVLRWRQYDAYLAVFFYRFTSSR
jgi:hypothetical protein